jgi:anti-sigma-K factor RskA
VQTNQELLALIAGTNPKRVIHLPGTKESPDAAGTFFMSGDERGVLVLQGLKPLPAAQTYQLWLISSEGAPASAGLLGVQPGGSTWLPVAVPARARNFVAVGVSIEPIDGSPAPTGPLVLLGTIG